MSGQRRFAAATSVAPSKTKGELDALLLKHGATQRGIFEQAGIAVVMFAMAGRNIRLQIKLPVLPPNPSAKTRAVAEQEERSAWRRLLLVTKAKLELVLDSGRSVESEFLADVLLPDGRTVHEALKTQLSESYSTGNMPPLLPAAGGSK